MTFSQGDVCIIAGGPSLTEEWYLKITNTILIGASKNKYHIFIDGTYYIPAINQGRVVMHSWTETLQLVAQQFICTVYINFVFIFELLTTTNDYTLFPIFRSLYGCFES